MPVQTGRSASGVISYPLKVSLPLFDNLRPSSMMPTTQRDNDERRLDDDPTREQAGITDAA
jgi:hypothetical protein